MQRFWYWIGIFALSLTVAWCAFVVIFVPFEIVFYWLGLENSSAVSVVGCFAGILSIGCGIYFAWWLARRMRQEEYVSQGRCRFCGYDLRYSSLTCPECGGVIPSADRREWPRRHGDSAE